MMSQYSSIFKVPENANIIPSLSDTNFSPLASRNSLKNPSLYFQITMQKNSYLLSKHSCTLNYIIFKYFQNMETTFITSSITITIGEFLMSIFARVFRQ